MPTAFARERERKKVYWTIIHQGEGGVLLDEGGCLVCFAQPEPGQTKSVPEIEQRLAEIRPEPAFRCHYVSDIDELSAIAKQGIVVCMEWQAENMPVRAYTYYHRECLEISPVELPKMKKHYLVQDQISPFVPCCSCGLEVKQ